MIGVAAAYYSSKLPSISQDAVAVLVEHSSVSEGLRTLAIAQYANKFAERGHF
jgi:hypothetical protein